MQPSLERYFADADYRFAIERAARRARSEQMAQLISRAWRAVSHPFRGHTDSPVRSPVPVARNSANTRHRSGAKKFATCSK